MEINEQLQIVVILGATNVALSFIQWALEKWKAKIDPSIHKYTSSSVDFLLKLLGWFMASRSIKK